LFQAAKAEMTRNDKSLFDITLPSPDVFSTPRSEIPLFSMPADAAKGQSGSKSKSSPDRSDVPGSRRKGSQVFLKTQPG